MVAVVRFSLFFLASILFLISSPAYSLTGPDLVKKELPLLYTVANDMAKKDDVEKFFEGWTERDISFVKEGLVPLDRQIKRQLSDKGVVIPSTAVLTPKNAFATLGEVYGNIQMRKRLEENPRWRYLNDVALREANEWTSRPDGLLLEIIDTQETIELENGEKFEDKDQILVIHGIHESKAGKARYNSEQARKYLAQWKTGFTIIVDGKPKHFFPSQIRTAAPTFLRNVYRPLLATSLEDIEALTTLTTFSMPKDFKGTVIIHPLSERLGQIAYSYAIQKLCRAVLPAGFDRVIEPQLDEATYRSAIQEWLIREQRWPSASNKQNPYEITLYIETVLRDGRDPVFVEYLEPWVQELVAAKVREGIPAAKRLRPILISSSATSASSHHALRIYFREYVPRHRFTNELDEFLRIRKWKPFFDTHRLDAKKHEIRVKQECAEQLKLRARAS